MALFRAPKHPAKGLRHPRIVARGDGFDLIAIGRKKGFLDDIYARLLGTSWTYMIGVMCALYLIINSGFAALYYAVPGCVVNARPHFFSDVFFFSVQTFATIGYGAMIPHGIYANILVTIESMCGFGFYGVVTGLMFSKFSRPTSRVLFSDKAIIGPHNGANHFMMRLANERNNRIADAKAKLTLMRDEYTKEGQLTRKFYSLALVRSEIPVLRLTWTLHHVIDATSPLFNMSQDELRKCEAEIIVTLNGLDETFSQNIHARHSYIADEIVCDASFVDVLKRRADYVLEVRYDKFHDIIANQKVAE